MILLVITHAGQTSLFFDWEREKAYRRFCEAGGLDPGSAIGEGVRIIGPLTVTENAVNLEDLYVLTVAGEVLVSGVGSCARCGADHQSLRFERLLHEMRDSDGTVWTHWARCPTNGQPILLREGERDSARSA